MDEKKEAIIQGGNDGQKADNNCEEYTKNDTLSQQVSCYSGISPEPTRQIEWQEAIQEIRSGKYQKQIEQLRQLLPTDAYGPAKKKLPSVTFGGLFSYRNKDGVAGPTGFLVADIDHISDIDKTFGLLCQDENTWFCFKSPGGNGLKCGLRTKNIQTDADHKKFYAAVERYFTDVYGIAIDKSCKDISRLTYLSHDTAAFINPDPYIFDIDAWTLEANPTQLTLPQIPTNGDSKEKYARKVLESACQKIRASAPGAKHSTRLKEARLVGGYLHYGITDAEALSALETAVAASGTVNIDSAMKTIRDGLENGKLSPVQIPEPVKSSDANDDKKPKMPSQSELLLELCKDLKLYRDTDNKVYALLPNRDFVLIDAKPFKDYLCRQFYMRYEKAPSREPLTAVLGVLRGKGRYDSPEVIPNIRLAGHDDCIYLDLCNSQREVVKVSADGWEVVRDYPVFFRRPKGMLPLPTPKPGGSIADLKRHLNIKDENSWRLIVGWMLQAFNPEGPYPILVINGEQGTAKSTTSKRLRNGIDPNLAPLRSLPRCERDLSISCNNSWIQVLENVSSLPVWLSDALCRLSTGGGFSTRTLYENDEETLFASKRPIILNGICNFVTRHDLADRALTVNLDPIPDEKRLPEKQLSSKFKKSSPYILGAFLDAVCVALKNIETTKLERLPRMADFALWVTAAEPALPWEPGGFIKTYDEKRAQSVREALESSPLGAAVLRLMDDRDSWEGTPSELFTELETMTDENTRKSKAWPGNVNWLSRRLVEVSSFLRKAGIEITDDRSNKTRHLKIVKNVVTLVTLDINQENQVVTGDKKGDDSDDNDKKPKYVVTNNIQLNQHLDDSDDSDKKKPTPCVYGEL